MAEQIDSLIGRARPGSGAATVAPPKATPAHEPRKQGVNVKMTPIPGVTPPGIFASDATHPPPGAPFFFQAPPIETFAEDGAASHSDYTTLSAGQHSQFVGRQLRTIQFDTLMVDWTPPWAVYGPKGWVPDSRKLTDALCAIRDAGKPFLLQAWQPVTRAGYDVNYPATLRSVHWEVRAGEIDGYYITVAFTEFSSPDIQEFLSKSSHHKDLPASLNTSRLPSNRNTLAKLAKFYYGDPSKWRPIAAVNGLKRVAINEVLSPTLTGRKRITVPVQRKPKKSRGQHA